MAFPHLTLKGILTLDGYLINLEQTNVQTALNNLRITDPNRYKTVVFEINSLMNPKGISRSLGRFYGSDRAYQKILDQVRSDLGGEIDFSNQAHREALSR